MVVLHWTAIPSLERTFEYKQFIGTPLWKERDPNYLTDKIDPGIKFMMEVRKRIKDLHLKGAPAGK